MYPFPGLAGRLATRIRPDLPPPIAEDAVKHSWASYSGTVQHLILAAQPPPELRSLSVPIRIVAGDQDEVIDLAFLRELDEGSDTVGLEVWEGGHDLPLTDALASVATVRSMVAAGGEHAGALESR
jgi:pimeloyl-ACP methyl ester carboxylesterase